MGEDKKELVKKREEELTNRILVVFCVSLLTLLGVMFLYRIMLVPKRLLIVKDVSFIFGIIFAALGAVSIVAAIQKYVKRSVDYWAGRLAVLGVICFVYSGIMLLIHYRSFSAFRILYVALPVMSFLYLIYNIYQRDFFWQCIVVGCAGGTLYAFSRWLHYKPWQPVVHVVYITAIVLLVAGLVATFALKKSGGKLFGLRLFSDDANYRLMFSTFVLMLLAIVLVLLIGSGVAFWMMVGVFAYLFILAVYYTIKLM